MRPRLGSRLVFLLLGLVLAGAAAGIMGVSSVAAAESTSAVDSREIERRLALPPFAYVAETDYDIAKLQKNLNGYTGVAAFIDSATDALVARPTGGTSPQGVAVSPGGSRFYVTDAYEAVLHVFDAETRQELLKIPLPGVEARDFTWMVGAFQSEGGTFPYVMMRSSASGVACTPDGSLVLVCSSAGLQVVDAVTNQVVRTLPNLAGGSLAVSFDGKRAYVACDTFDKLAPRTFLDWVKVIMTSKECRLVCIDLETWQILGEIPTGIVAGIAVKPDDSQVFFSETYEKRVRVVDALSLDDLWDVSTQPSYSVGIGFLPNGTKAYVVCSADNGVLESMAEGQTVPSLPTAEEFFCAVIDTAGEEIVKRIPLEAY
ncbi:MAG: YncE family protein [bacterium]